MPDDQVPTESLELFLDLVRFEREEQMGLYEALDTKAATLVGFAAAVLALIAGIIVTSDWGWGMAYLPATAAAAHSIYHGYHARRLRNLKRQSPTKSVGGWATRGERRDRQTSAGRQVADRRVQRRGH